MPKSSRENLFKRLTRLFKSGPVVRRKVKSIDTRQAGPDPEKSSAVQTFQKSYSPIYNTIVSNAFNLSERLARYQDFQSMEMTPEIHAALDLYADETVASDDKGRTLHIYSENPKIKSLLDDLFYDTLNVEFNLRPWTRNLVKYGDIFLYNDVHPKFGVINVIPIPVNEIEREEGFDPADPMAVRYRWTTMGNSLLDNWEVTHMRLLGDDMFLPYGTSIIESARKIWRQLILIEDAMLVYRIVRAPERRVFYIDVGNAPNEDIPQYMEAARRTLRTAQVLDADTSRVDLRYNPMSVDEDFFVAVRGAQGGTKIENLAGGQNTAAVEDVQYIQRKLFAALKVPKAYLGYDDMLSSKSTLAQEDIRFSRTISMIQRTIIAELNKVAIIHLVAHGFSGDDLLDFELRLSNPSTVAQQQKLELWRTKFEIAGTGMQAEGLVNIDFLRKHVMNLTDDDSDDIKRGLVEDKIFAAQLEAMTGEATEGGGGGGGGFGGGGGGGGPSGGSEEGAGESPEGGETPPGGTPEAGAPAGGEAKPEKEESGADEEKELIRSGDDKSDKRDVRLKVGTDQDAPIKARNTVMGKYLYNQSRHLHGSSHTERQSPDFLRTTSMKGHRDNDPFDSKWINAVSRNKMESDSRWSEFKELLSESSSPSSYSPSLSREVKDMIERMQTRLAPLDRDKKKTLLSEHLRHKSKKGGEKSNAPLDEDLDLTVDGEREHDTYAEDREGMNDNEREAP